jgi:hypothetical protein
MKWRVGTYQDERKIYAAVNMPHVQQHQPNSKRSAKYSSNQSI